MVKGKKITQEDILIVIDRYGPVSHTTLRTRLGLHGRQQAKHVTQLTRALVAAGTITYTGEKPWARQYARNVRGEPRQVKRVLDTSVPPVESTASWKQMMTDQEVYVGVRKALGESWSTLPGIAEVLKDATRAQIADTLVDMLEKHEVEYACVGGHYGSNLFGWRLTDPAKVRERIGHELSMGVALHSITQELLRAQESEPHDLEGAVRRIALILLRRATE